jgi:hypothetical protein
MKIVNFEPIKDPSHNLLLSISLSFPTSHWLSLSFAHISPFNYVFLFSVNFLHPHPTIPSLSSWVIQFHFSRLALNYLIQRYSYALQLAFIYMRLRVCVTHNTNLLKEFDQKMVLCCFAKANSITWGLYLCTIRSYNTLVIMWCTSCIMFLIYRNFGNLSFFASV